MLSDYKESHIGQANTDSTNRRDVDWILSDTPLSKIGKLSQTALAHKWSGHGTSMVDLKKAANLPRKTPCTIPLFNILCDCLTNAAYDVGRGRGNPRNICLGHNCWGVTINVPLQEIDKGEIRKWISKYGCSMASKCPLGFCVHIRGVANLDVEKFAQILDMVNDRHEVAEITLEDIADLRPPDYMNQAADLQTFRCTNSRELIIPDDQDYHAQSIHRLWTQVMKYGATTALAKITPATEAAPPPTYPDTRTYDTTSQESD